LKVPCITAVFVPVVLVLHWYDFADTETDLLLVKAVLMLFIVYSIKENPLMTMGDAVASFLDERDVTTASMGLMSLYDCKKGYFATKTT
jgi:hypothetical protein